MSGDSTVETHDLSPVEARVLGCLIEKELTTPDSYPLTLNALRSACNQTTSRDPVVRYDDHAVEQALVSLRERGITRTVHSTSNRAAKYRHVAADVLDLDDRETALIAVLLLRGAQTTGELKSRTERLHRFTSVDEVAASLLALSERRPALVRRLERAPGQKDARWAHLLSGDHDDGAAATPQGAVDTDHPAVRRDGDDPYSEATAEFYELLASAMWDSFGLQLLDLLDGVDPANGPILDVGSGSGVGLAYVHAAVPTARIVAIEPSKAMRTALHTRLAIDERLRPITTVVPSALGDAPLPDRVSALVASAALGHLTERERARLWQIVAERMPVGAPAVIGVVPPRRPVTVPSTRYRRLPVGDFVYEGWQEGAPIDRRTMAWTMTYRVLRGDELVAEYVARSQWTTIDADDIRSEVDPLDLSLEEHEDCVVVRRTR